MRHNSRRLVLSGLLAAGITAATAGGMVSAEEPTQGDPTSADAGDSVNQNASANVSVYQKADSNTGGNLATNDTKQCNDAWQHSDGSADGGSATGGEGSSASGDAAAAEDVATGGAGGTADATNDNSGSNDATSDNTISSGAAGRVEHVGWRDHPEPHQHVEQLVHRHWRHRRVVFVGWWGDRCIQHAYTGERQRFEQREPDPVGRRVRRSASLGQQRQQHGEQ